MLLLMSFNQKKPKGVRFNYFVDDLKKLDSSGNLVWRKSSNAKIISGDQRPRKKTGRNRKAKQVAIKI